MHKTQTLQQLTQKKSGTKWEQHSLHMLYGLKNAQHIKKPHTLLWESPGFCLWRWLAIGRGVTCESVSVGRIT